MKLGELIGKELSDKEKSILRDVLIKTGGWLESEVRVAIDFELATLPDAAPETADDALARLALVNASLDEKARIKAARANIMKAAQKIVLAALERGLPLLLTTL